MSPFLLGAMLLLVFQCVGEALARFTGAPVPGPVLGMIVLVVVLLARPSLASTIGVAADALARHLSLLFVPAGVGVMLYAGELASEWLAVAAALLVSTIAAIAVAAATFSFVLKRTRAADDASGPDA